MNRDYEWHIPQWGHLIYAASGVFFFGVPWLVWVIHVMVNAQHNRGVRQRYQEALAQWEAQHGRAWREHQARQQSQRMS